MRVKKWMLLSLFAFCTLTTFAQRSNGDIGLGLQFGQPTGISMQFYRADAPSWDFLVAWDLDDYFFVNGHALWEKSLAGSPVASFYYGPGAFIGLRQGNGGNRIFENTNDDVAIGVSGRVGLNFLVDQFEIFAHLTPRLTLNNSTDVSMGGGFGGRFYF